MSDELEPQPDGQLHAFDIDARIEVRDIAKREIDLRIVPWDVVVQTNLGPEVMTRGAFDGIEPGDVVIRLLHEDPPAGVGVSLEQRDDAAYMTFKISATQRGDEILALAQDRVTKGASVGFEMIPGGTAIQLREGRRTLVHRRVALKEVSTTWRPAYPDTAVLAVREEEGEPSMPEQQTTGGDATVELTPIVQSTQGDEAILAAVADFQTRSAATQERILDRLQAMEERQRQAFAIPSAVEAPVEIPMSGQWLSAALRILTGERIPDLQKRELAELITTDNVGVVPPAYSSELIGVIDPSRPFLNTTRRLQTPDSGMQLILPKIVTRPTVGIQVNEKDELTSTETSITTVSYDAVTKGGAGDISLQLLKRSSPSFLTLYLQLLAEAYALDSEHEALEAMVDLVGDYGGVTSGGTLDPEDLSLGSAWEGGFSAMRRPPDTIWLSSAAVGSFIDAKANGTNAPLYSQLSANFTAGGGVGGSIQGLRAVHVPALDDQAYDVLVGPSTGFAWAEDGTFTLQVDVPAKAGRDVALVGILWFAPIYPAAFTAYTIAS